MELRPYSSQDLDLTVALESDPDVMGHLGGPRTYDDAVRLHETRLAGVARGDLYFTIIPDGSTRPVGIVAIWETVWQGATIHELGGMLLPRYQLRGLPGPAFALAVRHARDKGIARLHAFPAVTNGASNALMRKLGFTRIGECDLDYEGSPLRCNHWTRDL